MSWSSHAAERSSLTLSAITTSGANVVVAKTDGTRLVGEIVRPPRGGCVLLRPWGCRTAVRLGVGRIRSARITHAEDAARFAEIAKDQRRRYQQEVLT